jgi:hypothetical protein
MITVEPGYNDTGLCDTSSTSSDILWYPLNLLKPSGNFTYHRV